MSYMICGYYVNRFILLDRVLFVTRLRDMQRVIKVGRLV